MKVCTFAGVIVNSGREGGADAVIPAETVPVGVPVSVACTPRVDSGVLTIRLLGVEVGVLVRVGALV